MYKILTSIILMFVLTTNVFADHWRINRYPRYGHRPRHYNHYHRYNSHNNYGRISPGAATAVGLGAGVLGYVIGRSTKKPSESHNSKIECKEFDVKVMIDGEERKAKITKCRTEDGSWQIPE